MPRRERPGPPRAHPGPRQVRPQAAVAACPDLEKDVTARLPPDVRVTLGEAVVVCAMLSMCGSKKGKVLSQDDAKEWLDCIQCWLRSAGWLESEAESLRSCVSRIGVSVR